MKRRNAEHHKLMDEGCMLDAGITVNLGRLEYGR